MTVTVRTLVSAVAAAAALLAAYFLGSAAPGAMSAAATPAAIATDEPRIAITGAGQATGVPDQLKFDVSVHAQALDVSTAMASANRTTRAVLRAIHDQSIANRDVQTTGLSIKPTYDYSSEGPPLITGYAVSQDLAVLVRSLPAAGATINAAVEAGGNAVRLHGVRLQIGDEDALLREARAAAIADARSKAEQYAAAAGRQLGEVTSIREVTSRNTPAYSRGEAYAVLDRKSAVPIRAGSADLAVRVAVVWTLS